MFDEHTKHRRPTFELHGGCLCIAVEEREPDLALIGALAAVASEGDG